MRPFLVKCLFFLVPVLVTFGLVELFLRSVPTSYKIKDRQLAADASNVRLLILGNSHATYGLNPCDFSVDAFNIASVNQSLYFDKRITLKYLDRLTNLKYVLISVDYHSLYFSDEGVRDLWSYYGYGINYKDSLPAGARDCYLYGYKGPLALEFLARPFEKKYQRIRSVDVDYDLDLDHPYAKGYVGKVGGPYLAKDVLRQRAAFFNDIVHHSHEHDSIIADLEGFIDTLKRRNIIPILITLPCFPPFERLLDSSVMAQNAADIRAICTSRRIPYWDYFTMPLDSDCFYNADHLNEKGAGILSRAVDRRISTLADSPQAAAMLTSRCPGTYWSVRIQLCCRKCKYYIYSYNLWRLRSQPGERRWRPS
ncbi:MAG TPA: SGNH/GDSL hydrolase family protein [Puia sp.]|nr:SGNH/GDSL hydrolase family protein [Puia sp.]